MAIQVKMKCLRCEHEYLSPPSENPSHEERTCPRCRSNSVRLVKEAK
jgi:DNA-directed RNA polymerase subunit RPC12/RpoP